jgi:hypothetical protein
LHHCVDQTGGNKLYNEVVRMCLLTLAKEKRSYVMSEKRGWVLAALWFGTIALVGLLKKALERQKPI